MAEDANYVGDHFRLAGQRRGFSPRDGREKGHAVSRHCPEEEGCVDEEGNIIGRASATQFPSHMNQGDITQSRKWLQHQWILHRKDQPSQITHVQEAGGGFRVQAKFCKFGVKELGGFVRQNEVVTVFPDSATGGNFLEDGSGRRFKKYE